MRREHYHTTRGNAPFDGPVREHEGGAQNLHRCQMSSSTKDGKEYDPALALISATSRADTCL
eukprot:6252266-Amphidinium_carterae.2